MTELLINVVRASFYGSIIIVAVCLLRLLLKRAPKGLTCLLWLLAGLRLVMPFEIESNLSLQPRVAPVALQQPAMIQMPDVPIPDIVPTTAKYMAVPEGIPPKTEQTRIVYTAEAGNIRSLTAADILTLVWLAGIAVLMCSSGASYWKLRRNVREAWPTGNRCWECDRIDTAFVLGFLRPRIYLPAGLGKRERKFILSHENTHIRRCDHLWKLAGYGILAVHWFNPLVWLAYSLLCRDMELACDEQVIRYIDVRERKAYSMALLSCAAKHGRFAVCPVAFSESDVKGRIKNVLNYRKPGFWITVAAILAAVFVAVCLVTSPKEEAAPEEIIASNSLENATLPGELPQNSQLQRCRDAMQRLQSDGELYLFVENLDDPNAVTNTYMRTADGWLFQYQQPLRDPEPVKWLCCGDSQYLYGGTMDEEGVMTTPYYWQVEKNPESHNFQLPYPFDLDWQSIELIYEDTEKEEKIEIITVQFPDYLDLFTFCFDADGTLLYFDVGDSTGEPEATTCRFHVRIAQGDTVSDYLCGLHDEACAALEKAEYCTDTNCTDVSHGHEVHPVCTIAGCTDSSHDHSTRDCADENCTDRSHGHRHHDH